MKRYKYNAVGLGVFGCGSVRSGGIRCSEVR